jgi:hypothetical protein
MWTWSVVCPEQSTPDCTQQQSANSKGRSQKKKFNGLCRKWIRNLRLRLKFSDFVHTYRDTFVRQWFSVWFLHSMRKYNFLCGSYRHILVSVPWQSHYMFYFHVCGERTLCAVLSLYAQGIVISVRYWHWVILMGKLLLKSSGVTLLSLFVKLTSYLWSASLFSL